MRFWCPANRFCPTKEALNKSSSAEQQTIYSAFTWGELSSEARLRGTPSLDAAKSPIDAESKNYPVIANPVRTLGVVPQGQFRWAQSVLLTAVRFCRNADCHVAALLAMTVAWGKCCADFQMVLAAALLS